MEKIRSIYTAHTFSERHLIRDKLCPFLQKIGIETKNPFYNPDKTVREGRPEVEIADSMEKGIDPRDDITWMSRVQRKCEEIVSNDLKLIDASEGVVAYMQEWSGGTSCEIFYAGYVKQKPVFLISGNSGIYKHPWMNEACKYGKIFRSLNAFKKFMLEEKIDDE